MNFSLNNFNQVSHQKIAFIILGLFFALGIVLLVKPENSGIATHEQGAVSIIVLNLKEKPFLTAQQIGGIISILVSVFGLLYIYRNKDQLHSGSRLTLQEEKIGALIKNGLSNKEIANELHISLSTVKTHINNIYKKTNCSSRKEFMKN